MIDYINDMLKEMVSPESLKSRRRRIARMAGVDSVVILQSAPAAQYSMDVDYPYRQNSDFFYLTGFTEPDSVAVIANNGGDEPDCTLFCLPRDPEAELWTGARMGCQKAKRFCGANRSFPRGDLDKKLPLLLRGYKKIYCHFDTPLAARLPKEIAARIRGATVPQLIDPGHLIDKLRLYKSAEEIGLMKKAAAISVGAHEHAMRICREGMFEYEVAAAIEYEFSKSGARVAYPTIAGSGVNACVLHYIENSRRMRSGELLLIDAGAEYAGYASDITRTFPVNGRFTDAQRDLYETVLEAQEAAIKVATPGNSKSDVHEAAVHSLVRGLVRLGLLKGRVATLIKRRAYRRFYMHNTGHWLGIDVHDCQRIPAKTNGDALRKGMVMTVEPGLYIPVADDIPKHWRGTGIRIEDDVLITANGNNVLTAGLMKYPDDIENWMVA